MLVSSSLLLLIIGAVVSNGEKTEQRMMAEKSVNEAQKRDSMYSDYMIFPGDRQFGGYRTDEWLYPHRSYYVKWINSERTNDWNDWRRVVFPREKQQAQQ